MISIKNISKHYSQILNSKKIYVLKNINFEIKKNEILTIVGPNGSGKSTLLKILFNLIQQDSGEICIKNSKQNYIDFIKDSASLINRNERSFFWRRTVKENINFFNSLLRTPSTEPEIQEKINFMGLANLVNNKFGTLSSGEKTKVLILRGLIKNPEFILFDEITNSLDIDSKSMVLEYVKKINNDGATIIWVSHSLDEIDSLSDRFLIMKEGEIFKEKNVSEINLLPSKYIYKELSQ